MQTERFDVLRDTHKDLGFAVYALEPASLVTFEVYTPDGQVYSFKGRTLQEAITAAFPPEQESIQDSSIFD